MDQAHLEYYRDGHAHSVALGGNRLAVGRAATNDLVLPADAAISAEHAVLEPAADGWCIRDVGSSNGTFVNGRQLTEPQLLRSGDEIRLGGSRLTFRVMRSDYLDVSEEWSGSTGSQPIPRAAPAAPAPRPTHGSAPVSHPASVTPSGPAPQGTAGPRRRGTGHIRGAARGIQVRRDANNRESLVFRVERYDASGNRLAPVAVELPTYVSGQISDGEEVDVTGRWSHGTLRAKKIVNLSTGARLQGVGLVTNIILGLIVAIILMFICGIAVAGFFFGG